MEQEKGKEEKTHNEKESCEQCKISSCKLKQCLQCKKVKYCSTDCQIKHWSIHKLQCISAESKEFLQLLAHNRRSLLSFLEKGNYGNYDVLMEMFRQISVSTNDPLAIRRWSLNPEKIDPIFEWPTNELCHCIRAIMMFEDSTEILEVGAGCGLLSARFNEYNKEFDVDKRMKSIPSNPHNDQGYTFTPGLTTRILNQAFRDIKERLTPILVAFQDLTTTTEFNDMIELNHPKFLLCIGQPLSNTNRQAMFIQYLQKKFDYSLTVFAPKQICNLDRPVKSKNETNYDCRAVVHYWRRNKPPLSSDQITEICGSKNLGTSKSAADDTVNFSLRKEDYYLNVQYDKELKLTCTDRRCLGCAYKFPVA